MILFVSALVIVLALLYTLGVREKDLPAPIPESPFRHFDEMKARLYENLRDLQFEYRLGKLSDEDYQRSKLNVQKELAELLAGVEALKEKLTAEGKRVASQAPAPKKEKRK
jgi:beta-phosphoglucomutase-like phosphatase (HAD superfamily)